MVVAKVRISRAARERSRELAAAEGIEWAEWIRRKLDAAILGS